MARRRSGSDDWREQVNNSTDGGGCAEIMEAVQEMREDNRDDDE